MKELQEETAILEKSKANLETKFVSMVKAAEKRKDIQVMISEANALKRKSEEQAGEISRQGKSAGRGNQQAGEISRQGKSAGRGNQCFAKRSFTTSGNALQTLKKLIDFIS